MVTSSVKKIAKFQNVFCRVDWQNVIQLLALVIGHDLGSKNMKSLRDCTLEGIASIYFRFHFQQTLRMHTQGVRGVKGPEML